MTLTATQVLVPACTAMLTNIKGWLDKAAESGDASALVEAKLAPDMYALARQVQIASDTAKGAGARLAGVDSPSMPDTETTFAELKARCDQTIAFLQGLDPAAIDAGIAREIEIKFPSGGGIRFDATTYLTGFVLPNLYFHASMVYAILRNQGVALGKPDYLAHIAGHMFAPPAA